MGTSSEIAYLNRSRAEILADLLKKVKNPQDGLLEEYAELEKVVQLKLSHELLRREPDFARIGHQLSDAVD